jgi:hypothetical protein
MTWPFMRDGNPPGRWANPTLNLMKAGNDLNIYPTRRNYQKAIGLRRIASTTCGNFKQRAKEQSPLARGG